MYICLTHSPRPLDFSRSSRPFLKDRYKSPQRLLNLPDFESLSEKDAPKWHNNLTIWKLNPNNLKFTLLYFFEKNYTANHAIIDKNTLLICGSTFFERINLKSQSGEYFSHNWFAGGHTVYFDPTTKQFCFSCAASDAVLFFDPGKNIFTNEFRMPEKFYGHNYNLNSSSDVRKHYINNDTQLTHLNCCYPCQRGYLVTAFIQGAVGIFDFNGNYTELAAGYLGCHGARTRPGLNGFYFADSPLGYLYEMTWSGSLMRKFKVNSGWLHDTQWIKDDLYLFSIGNKNQLQLWDINQNIMIWNVDLAKYGNTSLLLSSSK